MLLFSILQKGVLLGSSFTSGKRFIQYAKALHKRASYSQHAVVSLNAASVYQWHQILDFHSFSLAFRLSGIGVIKHMQQIPLGVSMHMYPRRFVCISEIGIRHFHYHCPHCFSERQSNLFEVVIVGRSPLCCWCQFLQARQLEEDA